MNLTDRRQDAVNKTLYPRALANEIEDPAVGYWLAVAQRENSRFRIRYVNAEPGSVRLVNNRPVHACTPGPNGIFDGDGSNSWRQVVAIHPLKEACGLAYVWQQLIMAQPTRLRRGGGASNGDRKKAVDEGRRRGRAAAPLINTTITLPHENTKKESSARPPARPPTRTRAGKLHRPRKGYEPCIHFPLKTRARGRQAGTQHCVTKHKSATLLNEEGHHSLDHSEC
jgi:hypothetical protein